MEKIKVGELLKLENDKEYICFYELEDNNTNYLYLATPTKPIEVKFAKYKINENNDSLIIIGNKQEKKYVYNLFKQKINK